MRRRKGSVQALVLDLEVERDPGHLGAARELGHQLAQDGRSLRVAERDHLALLLELAQEENVVHELPHRLDLPVGLPQERLQVGAGKLSPTRAAQAAARAACAAHGKRPP